jgi:hypothetical protein
MRPSRRFVGAPLVVATLVATSGCARDREAEAPVVTAPPPQPQPQPPQPQPRPAPFTPLPVAARPSPAPTPSVSQPTPAPLSSADLADLYRAQDACLSNCDQFACMRIAAAYRDGVGIPRDPLAGRRYAIHACLECGAPGVATEGQCPVFGVNVPAAPKKK